MKLQQLWCKLEASKHEAGCLSLMQWLQYLLCQTQPFFPVQSEFFSYRIQVESEIWGHLGVLISHGKLTRGYWWITDLRLQYFPVLYLKVLRKKNQTNTHHPKKPHNPKTKKTPNKPTAKGFLPCSLFQGRNLLSRASASEHAAFISVSLHTTLYNEFGVFFFILLKH